MGAFGEAPERRKESFEWETLNPCIGSIPNFFSDYANKKSPAEAGLESQEESYSSLWTIRA